MRTITTPLFMQKSALDISPQSAGMSFAIASLANFNTPIFTHGGAPRLTVPQSLLASQFQWNPTGSGSDPNLGMLWTGRFVGTGATTSHASYDMTSRLSQENRVLFITGTTATGCSGITSSRNPCLVTTTSRQGGFLFYIRFGITQINSTTRLFMGVSELNAALSAEPSTINNTICIGADSSDTNLQLITRNTSSTTKTDLGISKTAIDVLYHAFIYVAPGTSSVYCEIYNGDTMALLASVGPITSNVPVNTFMYAHSQIQSTIGTSAKHLNLAFIHVQNNI